MPAMDFVSNAGPGCLAQQPVQLNDVGNGPVDAWVAPNGGRPTASVLSRKVQGKTEPYLEFETGFDTAAEEERTRRPKGEARVSQTLVYATEVRCR